MASGKSTMSAPPSARTAEIQFRILSQNGDDRLAWDRRDAAQIREAQQKFYELLDSGHKAYGVGSGGGPREEMVTFNPEAEEVIFTPSVQAG